VRKLLVCDVEGTIFSARYKIDGMDYASTMWQPLARSLGDEGLRREKELHDRWERGEFKNYLDWVEETYRIHKELGLTKQTFEHLLPCAEYNPGVTEFFEKLNRKRFIPVLISGGFQELVRRAQQELKIPHGHGACEYTFDKRDNLLCSCSLVPCDFEGKYNFVKFLIERYKLNLNIDWVFIGDGKNDCDIAAKAPISFSFNGHQQLKEVTTYNIEDHDAIAANFTKISEILDGLSEEDFSKGYERKVNRAQTENRNKESNKAIKTSKKEEVIQDEDYRNKPGLHLSEIIEEYSIAFVGLREHYNTYKQLEEHYEHTGNFKLIPANFEQKNNADYKALKRRDFIFIDIDCISHSQGWRVEELGVPFAKIRRVPGQLNDPAPLERAMSNVLYRRFYEGES
jgi:phosphoserine phosphatase